MPHEMSYLSNWQLSRISQEVVLSPQRRVVLLDVGGLKDIPMHEHNRNIYCVGASGEVVWQVRAEDSTHERDSFVTLYVDGDKQLRADRFFGNEVLLDPITGIAEHVGWHK